MYFVRSSSKGFPLGWSERRRHAGALNCKALPASSMDRCLCVQDSMHVHSRCMHVCVGAGSTVLCGPQSHRSCTPARPAHAALVVCRPKRGPKQVLGGTYRGWSGSYSSISSGAVCRDSQPLCENDQQGSEGMAFSYQYATSQEAYTAERCAQTSASP